MPKFSIILPAHNAAEYIRIKTWEMPLYYYNYWRKGSISKRLEPDLRFYR